jgi:hypothetical protein
MQKKPKLRLFRVNIKRTQITEHSVLIDSPTPDQAVKDVVGDKLAVQKHFPPIYTNDFTVVCGIREVKRGSKSYDDFPRT